jgi:putative hydrolase of the HAD superfamily
MIPEAVLFDLDNTLADRDRSIERYSNAFFDRFSGQIAEKDPHGLARSIIDADGGGYTGREALFSQLVESLDWRERPATVELGEHWGSYFPGSAEPVPGLMSTLQALKGMGLSMGIVTNGLTASQMTKIEVLGLREYMGSVVVSEAAGVRKPDVAIFNLALSELKVKPARAWYVGDNPAADVVGASEAGLTPVWVKGHHPWPDGIDEPALQIDRLDELVPLVAASRSRSP